ncbi:esterase-like activity of phytase family protein [Massilia glaciei]|uniref:Esterase-like activity of phytase family protein n=1 Tax=Massilia glaciei TaxID=1524097 RepID=A0A2U2HPC4_9BURK|nr:esterase-like activity of phytase family protein [Massilia glaciei]PWF49343.1 esterase-like activity of phytase family protein [Massilia glaciei]
MHEQDEATFSQTTPLGVVVGTVHRYPIRIAAQFHVPYEGANSAVSGEFPGGFAPSYGSGLSFKGTNAGGEREFYCLTDRGPNGAGPFLPSLDGPGTSGSQIFPSPSFAPAIGVITLGAAGAALSASLPIRVSAQVRASGLPIPFGAAGSVPEIPVLDAMRYDAAGKAAFSAHGLDTEALAFDGRRQALWSADEYGPFIVRLDPLTGIIVNKYGPGAGLPPVLAKRRANRGFEGMAFDHGSDKLHAFLQSPLADGDHWHAASNQAQPVERYARFTRWIEFDPASGSTSRMFAYPLDGADYHEGRTGHAKLGDMVALGGGKFVVIEQGPGPDGNMFHRLMLLELAGASDIAGAAFNPDSADLEKSSLGGAPVNGADWAAAVPLKKTLLLDLDALGWHMEKAEGLALVDGSTLALSNDSDFGLRSMVFDALGQAIAGIDTDAFTVDAGGVTVAGLAAVLAAPHSFRVTKGDPRERQGQLWLIGFDQPLGAY